MTWKVSRLYINHIKKSPRMYLFLCIIFILGIFVGSFSVKGLYENQRIDIKNYVQGFMNIFDIQKLDNWELFKVSLFRELKSVIILWALGVSVIGIPFIFLTVFVKGFASGVCFSIILMCLGREGIVIVLAMVLFKELFLVPVLLSLAVNGIMFSTEIIKSGSGKKISLENIKHAFFKYCAFASVQFVITILAVILEAVVVPVFIKI